MNVSNGETAAIKEASRRKRAKRKAMMSRAMRLSVVALGAAAAFGWAFLVTR